MRDDGPKLARAVRPPWLLVLLVTVACASAAPADERAARVRRHEPKMSFLDNGVVRLGVDLNLGGAITHLSRSGREENLVNGHDFGRQIQMSYYAGPVPFAVAGKRPDPAWAFIGWNPIQVGDAFGHASRLLAHTNDGKRIYVKCVPMHWPLENVPAECTFESWLRLEGAAVHARCRMVNNRPDKTQYPARDQEFPAVYTNGPWHRLMTYDGDAPFTGGPLRRVEHVLADNRWADWTATESWAALVDDGGFGLGVWASGVGAFKGGFAGTPGQGGPRDAATGYVAPIGREVIDWNVEHEYRYDLVVGTLDEIRKHVYDRAPRPAPPAHRFDGGRHGWHFANATDAGWPVRGALHLRTERPDPQLLGPVGFWKAADAGTLVIEAASRTRGADARVYWRRLGEPAFTEERSAGFTLTSDGTDQTYRIDLAKSPQWKGGIVQLRVDPVSAGGAGEWVKVRSIRFEK